VLQLSDRAKDKEGPVPSIAHDLEKIAIERVAFRPASI
jgi:hypothetical protein